MMSKSRISVFALLGILLAGGLGWFLLPREPVYQGKRLSAWLDLRTAAEVDGAQRAVRAIGTNALPWLLRDLRADDSSWREKIAAAVRKNPRLTWLGSKLMTPNDRRRRALVGFQILGPMAEPTVPALVKQLQDPNVRLRQLAISALALVGPSAKDAVQPLVNALKDDDLVVRRSAVYALGCLEAEGRPAIPALLSMLTNKEDQAWIRKLIQQQPPPLTANPSSGYVLHPIAAALGRMGPAAKEAVPALIEMLLKGEPAARASAAQALGMIGPVTRDVIPALEEAAEASDEIVRNADLRALRQIASDPAAKERLHYGNAVLKTLESTPPKP